MSNLIKATLIVLGGITLIAGLSYTLPTIPNDFVIGLFVLVVIGMVYILLEEYDNIDDY